jgi:hypothetical protein
LGVFAIRSIRSILTYIFSKRKTLNKEDIRRVRRWFWLSSFSERYRGASEHFISKDLEYIDDYVVNGKIPDASFGAVPPVNVLSRLTFRSNNSRSRAFILLLALQNPRNLTNGATIDTAEALSSYNKKQFHHIFPKAHLVRAGEKSEHNTSINICMLSASENNSISDDDPLEYLPKLIREHKSEASAIFLSNLLPDPTVVDYCTIRYDKFLTLRSKIVHERMLALSQGEI